MQSTINMIYSAVKNKKKRERFETILEPLQAILQIGYLSFTPIGTKLTIHNNILQIQHPNYSQPVIRWYNNDTQEDLFYLFNIFYRFKKFYVFLNEGATNKNEKANSDNKKLYTLLIEMAKNGIANLIRTYSQTEKIHILHTLQMYKNILEGGSGDSLASVNNSKRFENFELDNLVISPASNVSRNFAATPTSTIPGASFTKKDNKKKQHQQQLLRDDDQDASYMDGLNKMLEPTNNRIKKWIDENIVF